MPSTLTQINSLTLLKQVRKQQNIGCLSGFFGIWQLMKCEKHSQNYKSREPKVKVDAFSICSIFNRSNHIAALNRPRMQ